MVVVMSLSLADPSDVAEPWRAGEQEFPASQDTNSPLLQTRDIAIMSRDSGVQAPVIPRLNVAAEKIMSPIADSPMTLQPARRRLILPVGWVGSIFQLIS